ncbi:MAG: hypothetical protein OQK04_12165 [Kangiellaceae bacterium]|nr:hypothetical protein [Kangiellaceae bacterium]MCW8999456.1 hypothetical protein [Kangiellaceae bacterium]
MNKAVALFAILIMSGCSNTRNHLLDLDNYGSYPQHYQKIAKSFLSTLFEEPASVKYKK